MKCRETREMKKTEEVTMKNKRKALRGECVTCGTKMFKIMASAKKAVTKKGSAPSKKSKSKASKKAKKSKKSKKTTKTSAKK